MKKKNDCPYKKANESICRDCRVQERCTEKFRPKMTIWQLFLEKEKIKLAGSK